MGVERAPSVTLAEALREWVQVHSRTRSKSHVAGVRRSIEAHCSDHLGKPIKALRTGVVEAFLDKYPGTDGGRAYLLRSLKALCNWAVRREYLEAVPFRVGTPRVQEKVRPTILADRLGEFLSALETVVRQARAGEDVVPMVRMILALGLREAEVRTARVEWLDTSRWRYTPGLTKGGEAVELHVPTWAREELAALVHGRTAGLMFPSRFGGPHKRAYLLPYVRQAGEKIGLHGLTPHRLRGSFATILHQAGSSLRDVQAALRHVSISTTLRYVEAKAIGVAFSADSMMVPPSTVPPERDKKRDKGSRKMPKTSTSAGPSDSGT